MSDYGFASPPTGWGFSPESTAEARRRAIVQALIEAEGERGIPSGAEGGGMLGGGDMGFGDDGDASADSLSKRIKKKKRHKKRR